VRLVLGGDVVVTEFLILAAIAPPLILIAVLVAALAGKFNKSK
jgi:hypothetical protein